MARNFLWIDEPPEASAETWAEVWSQITGLMPVDEEDDATERDRLLSFVLREVLRRCAVEAENRKSGILGEQVQADIESTRGWIEGGQS